MLLSPYFRSVFLTHSDFSGVRAEPPLGRDNAKAHGHYVTCVRERRRSTCHHRKNRLPSARENSRFASNGVIRPRRDQKISFKPN